jgi:hypothetical protein
MKRKIKQKNILAEKLKTLPGALERHNNNVGPTIERSATILPNEYITDSNLGSNDPINTDNFEHAQISLETINSSEFNESSLKNQESRHEEYVYLTDDENNRALFTVTSLPDTDSSLLYPPPDTIVVSPETRSSSSYMPINSKDVYNIHSKSNDNDDGDADCE